MAWFILVIAGLLETCWAIGLSYTDGFKKPLPSVLTAIAMIASMWLLSISLRTLPVGTAYAVWVGIGATGASIFGVILLKEPVTAGRAFFMILMIASIIGLKFTTPTKA